eukprot:gb/GEZN01001742.1/.p1 GENE.gb/GEZN01001742.1/~~gb/GEZN01001742.1/.p1  ORF type:complete len:811 (-),score=174.17 gb/GEZN01001742.1/:420-2543(-)
MTHLRRVYCLESQANIKLVHYLPMPPKDLEEKRKKAASMAAQAQAAASRPIPALNPLFVPLHGSNSPAPTTPPNPVLLQNYMGQQQDAQRMPSNSNYMGQQHEAQRTQSNNSTHSNQSNHSHQSNNSKADQQGLQSQTVPLQSLQGFMAPGMQIPPIPGFSLEQLQLLKAAGLNVNLPPQGLSLPPSLANADQQQHQRRLEQERDNNERQGQKQLQQQEQQQERQQQQQQQMRNLQHEKIKQEIMRQSAQDSPTIWHEAQTTRSSGIAPNSQSSSSFSSSSSSFSSSISASMSSPSSFSSSSASYSSTSPLTPTSPSGDRGSRSGTRPRRNSINSVASIGSDYSEQSETSNSGNSSTSTGSSWSTAERARLRKAEVARQCRLRKKEYIKGLEEETALQAKLIETLQEKVRKYEQGHALIKEAVGNSCQAINLAVNRRSDSSEIKLLVKELHLALTSLGDTLNTGTESINNAIIPGPLIKFLMWLLTQEPEFYGQQGLWTTLVHGQLKLKWEQVQQLMLLRPLVLSNKAELTECQKKLSSLKSDLQRHAGRRAIFTESVLSTLSSDQIGALISWLNNNPACMQIVDAVWSHQPTQTSGQSTNSNTSNTSTTTVMHISSSSSCSSSTSGASPPDSPTSSSARLFPSINSLPAPQPPPHSSPSLTSSSTRAQSNMIPDYLMDERDKQLNHPMMTELNDGLGLGGSMLSDP